MVTLFDFDSNNRETKSIFRIFESHVLTSGLVKGMPWQWFAVNIPMDIFPDISKVRGDFDIIVKNSATPVFSDGVVVNTDFKPHYRVFEVKTILIDKTNKTRSLKSGKSKKDKISKQLNKMRKLGCPDVSFLELYVYENDDSRSAMLIPYDAVDEIVEKTNIMKNEKYGYDIIPFSHTDDGSGGDLGILFVAHSQNPMGNYYTLSQAEITNIEDPFKSIVERLDNFYGEAMSKFQEKNPNIGFIGEPVITYCKKCKSLKLIFPKTSSACPDCDMSIIDQSTHSKDPSYTDLYHEEIFGG